MPASLLLAMLTLVRFDIEPPSRGELETNVLQALKEGKTDQALKLANDAVEADPKSADAVFLRGRVFEALRKHDKAIADFDKAIALDPRAADAYNHRGSEYLKKGDFGQAIKDFDKFLEFRPDAEPGHWRRGIAYYYAGKYDLGRKQFEAYKKTDDADMENAMWHFLCLRRIGGPEYARKHMIKVRNDPRIPMFWLCAMYQTLNWGNRQTERIFQAVKEEGNPNAQELNERHFYAHLYIGLYYDVQGHKKVALEHITKAADDYKIEHYMWDIAALHKKHLRGELEQ